MPFKNELLEQFPDFLRDTLELQVYARVVGKQLEKVNQAIDDLLDNVYIDTATWGLDIREKDYGIQTDLNKSIDERRSNLKAKKRGVGTVNKDLVKLTAESYYGGEVDAIEKPKDLEVIVKFISSLGIPPNLIDVQNALEEILPAHLELLFEYTYLLIREIHGVKTLTEMEQIPLNKFAGGDSIGK